MWNADAEFLRFLRAVRRRLTIVRFVSLLTVFTLIGSAISLLLCAIQIARGESTTGVIIFASGVTCIAMLAKAWQDVPTLHDAAIEADRQLQLHDLLLSAL